MSNEVLSQQLDATVADLIDRYGLSTFHGYWDLYERVRPSGETQAWYFYVDPAAGYCNVAIIAGSKVIDVEGDDSASSGGATIRDLASIAAVHIRRGQLEGFSRSQGASIIVVTRLVGETSTGPYWVAKTSSEEDRLLGFARILASSISRQ